MIDNILIWSLDPRITKMLTSSKLKRIGLENYNNQHTFRLYHPLRKSERDAELQIKSIDTKNFVMITGSIRKWYLGNLSMDDLSKDSLYEALSLIAKELNIPIHNLLSFNISKIEVGLNMKLISENKILNKIVGFKNAYFEPALYRHSRSYFSANLKFTIYRKAAEIIKRIQKNKQGIRTEEERTFKRMNINNESLRIEYKILGGKKEVAERLDIEKATFKEILENYDKLYHFFWTNCQHINVHSKTDKALTFNEKKYTRKNLHEYFEYIGMYTLGLDTCLEMAHSSNDRGAKRNIQNCWEKYHTKLNDPYSKAIFLRQIRAELLIKLSVDGLANKKALLLPLYGHINSIVE